MSEFKEMENKEISVQFHSVIPFEQALPTNNFSVPVTLTRYGLSEIVNNLTGLEEKKCSRPFDFVVNGQLLRGDITRFLAETTNSGEKGLILEVVDAIKKPQTGTAQPHPDWISSVSTGPASEQCPFLATGSYDGLVRIWESGTDEEDPIEGKGHESAIKSVAFFQKPDSNGGWSLISGSKDKTARLWKYAQNKCECTAVFSSHTDSIEAVATQMASNRTKRFVTASWDKSLLIWKVPSSDDDNIDFQIKKRRIVGKKKKEPTLISEPIGDLLGHRGAVTCCVWPDPLAIYSGSYDRTIRLWEPREGKCVRIFQGNAVVTSLDFSARANLLISGHHDNIVRIWDSRMEGEAITKLYLKSHRKWVADVKWSPFESHICASVSYDHTVKIWDTRASIPLHTLTPHTDKVLCVDFDKRGQGLVTGGCDGQLCTHNFTR